MMLLQHRKINMKKRNQTQLTSEQKEIMNAAYLLGLSYESRLQEWQKVPCQDKDLMTLISKIQNDFKFTSMLFDVYQKGKFDSNKITL